MTIRSRAAQAQAPTQQQGHIGANGSGRPSLLKRGQAAQQARQQEGERQFQQSQNRMKPFRFWIPYKGNQDERTRDFIILDSDIANCPIFYEHALPDPNTGRRTNYEMCIKEMGHCPLCEKFGDSYYVQMISIIDLKPYTNRDGVQVNYSKKLLPVKYQLQEWFWNTCANTFNGNMRGAHIVSTRDANQRSHAIGSPNMVVENGRLVQYSEQDLVSSFGEDAVPFNYEELFPTPSAEELRAQYGGLPPAGSQQEVVQAWSQGGTGPVYPLQRQLPGDKITARDVKRQMQKSQPQQDDSDLEDDLEDLPF